MSIHILFGDFFVETDELNGQTDRQTDRKTDFSRKTLHQILKLTKISFRQLKIRTLAQAHEVSKNLNLPPFVE